MKASFTEINRYLFRDEGGMTYVEFQLAIIRLCEAIEQADDIEWLPGLDDLIIGSYWHFTEWHEGQNSLSYQALCALGRIYKPRGNDKEQNVVYRMLEVKATSEEDE